jgi:hypothetical protein
MKPETKLAIRRFAVRWMRKLLDVLDDRLHAAEVRLREDLERAAPGRVATPIAKVGSTPTARSKVETFQQWEARRSGIIVTDGCKTPGKTKSLNGLLRPTHKRGMPSAEFDLRFAR